MPRCYTLSLPKTREPRFPNRCAVCLGVPTTRANVAHNNGLTRGAFWFRLLELFGEGSVALPVCRPCWWRFRLQRFFRGSGLVLLAIIAYFVTTDVLFAGGLDDTDKRLLMLVLGLGFGIPYLVLETAYPRYFYSYISGDDIVYEFSSRRYAQWFQGFNGGQIQSSA